MEFFTANFLRCFKCRNLPLELSAGYSLSNPSICWTKEKFSKICFSMECFTISISRCFSTNVKITLLRCRLDTRRQIEETVLKREKVYKCFVQDCR